MQWIVDGVYLLVAVLFIVGLKAMSSPVKARRGITWAGIGMVLAVAADNLDTALRSLGAAGETAWHLGEITARPNGSAATVVV